MGNWSGAIIRSIGWVLLFVVAYSIYELGIPIYAYPINDFVAIFCFFAVVYLALSIVGWTIIGLPFHWVVCKWSEAKFYYYILAGAFLFIIFTALWNLEAGIVFGAATILQATIFRFYVFKTEKI